MRAFLRKLEALDPESRAALALGQGVVEVRSALQLDDELRAKVAQGVSRALGHERLLSFRHDPGLLLGLELCTQGRCLGWSAAELLDEVNAKLEGVLHAAAQD